MSHHRKSCLQFRWANCRWSYGAVDFVFLGFLTPETSQLASTSVGGVTSSARADGVPEIAIMAVVGAASVSAPGSRPVPIVVVVPPAVVMILIRPATLHGASICEVYN